MYSTNSIRDSAGLLVLYTYRGAAQPAGVLMRTLSYSILSVRASNTSMRSTYTLYVDQASDH